MELNLNNDLDNKYLDEIKVLLIDVLLLLFIVFNNKNFKAFFILSGIIEKAKEIAINFADRLFSYFFITFGNILPNYINFANATDR